VDEHPDEKDSEEEEAGDRATLVLRIGEHRNGEGQEE